MVLPISTRQRAGTFDKTFLFKRFTLGNLKTFLAEDLPALVLSFF